MTSLLPTAASTGRPEPVLDAAKLAAAVSGTVLSIGALLVLIGWATADEVQSWAVIAGGIVTSVGALIAVVMPIITALGARAQVTPLAAPVSAEGVPLITTAAAVTVVDGREITDALRQLDQDDATRPVDGWRPPTPAAVAAEPTPIAEAAQAASTGRTAPVSTSTT